VRATPAYVRIGTGIVVLAVVVVVFLVGAPGGDDDEAPAPESTPQSSTTVAPGSVSTDDFCVAFSAMAAAHANHLANDTDASLAEVTAAATTVRNLAPGTAMPPAALRGLEEMVAGVLGEATTPPDQPSADALSDFLEVSCPAGAR
jgi:hypothetical protein